MFDVAHDQCSAVGLVAQKSRLRAVGFLEVILVPAYPMGLGTIHDSGRMPIRIATDARSDAGRSASTRTSIEWGWPMHFALEASPGTPSDLGTNQQEMTRVRVT